MTISSMSDGVVRTISWYGRESGYVPVDRLRVAVGCQLRLTADELRPDITVLDSKHIAGSTCNAAATFCQLRATQHRK